jgi:hypothetical protein
MTFSFHVPLWLPDDQRIICEQKELLFSSENGIRVLVRADGAEEIGSSERLSLRGDGYSTQAAAATEGSRWLAWLSLGFLDLLIGVDLRPFGPRSHMSEYLLNHLRNADPHHQHFGEHSGVLAFPTDPPVIFYGLEAKGVAGKRGEDLLERTLLARDRGASTAGGLELALNLYGSAMFLPSDESRFIALMSAVESLIVQPKRPDVAINLIGHFIAEVADSELGPDDKSRLSSALGGLKRESIGAAGRQLAARLENKLYLDQLAPDFWTYAYGLRSATSHGRATGQLMADMRAASPQLQWFFRDLVLLLSQPISAVQQ